MVDLTFLTQDISILSSIAVILGVIFVVVQLRQNNKMIASAAEQSKLASLQTKLSTEQITQTNNIADMDLVMRLYEFANTSEVVSSWLTVLHSNIQAAEDFGKLSSQEQAHFFQIAALFESLGVLRKKGMVDLETIEDMFMVRVAWEKLEKFMSLSDRMHGIKDGEGYIYFTGMAKEIISRQS